VRCVFEPPPDQAAAGRITLHYAVSGGRAWLVQVQPGIDTGKRDRFLASLRLPS
jgi:hypothetical protein